MVVNGSIPRRVVKPEGGLKRIAEAKKSGSHLLEDVERHLIGEAEDGYDPTNRRMEVIHPSEVASGDWCPYSTFLRIKLAREGRLPPRPANRFQLQNIFDEGHEYHRKWQSRAERMGRLYGTWECHLCHHRWKAVSPKECLSCGESAVNYREVGLHDDQANIHGHADGHITLEPFKESLDDYIWEVKSIGLGTVRMDNPKVVRDNTYEVTTHTGMKRKVVDHEGIWAAIKMPFPAHLRQGLIYLRLYNKLDKIVFLYEYKATSAVKTFTVKRDDMAVDYLWDVCYDIMYALDKGSTPPACPKGGCDQCTPLLEHESEHENDTHSTPSTPSTPAVRPRSRRTGAARAGTAEPAGEPAGGDERRPVRSGGPGADEPDVFHDGVGRLRRWTARRGRD